MIIKTFLAISGLLFRVDFQKAQALLFYKNQEKISITLPLSKAHSPTPKIISNLFIRESYIFLYIFILLESL